MGRNLSYIDRLKLEVLLNKGFSKRQIADYLGCCLATVYNEIKRGQYVKVSTLLEPVSSYSADIAQQKYRYNATAKGKPLKLGKRYDFVEFIEVMVIDRHFSPAVALQLWRQQSEFSVSLTTLYRYIDRGYFPHLENRHLPEKVLRRVRRGSVRAAKRPAAGVSVERRSPDVAARASFGHWEMDTVVGKASGKGQALLVLTERLSRYEIIVKLRDKTASSVVRAFDRLFCRYGHAVFRSVTVDNGSEFSDVHGLAFDKKGNRRTYISYCHPYSSWERGSNERNNRMIRRFFPKGSSFSGLTQKDCDAVADWLNRYPRRILNWQTAQEVFSFYVGFCQS